MSTAVLAFPGVRAQLCAGGSGHSERDNTPMDSQQIIREVINLVVPVSCVGCGEPDTQWCTHCCSTPTRHHQPSLAWREALWAVPVWAVVDYEGTWRRTVLSWKDRGAHRLAKPLGIRMAGLLARFPMPTGRPTLLVPVPSSWGGWIARGIEPTVALAVATARAWNSSPTLSLGQNSRPQPAGVLVLQRGLRHLGGFSLLAQLFSPPHRRKRRSRGVRLAKPSRFVATHRLRGHRVILIDDVLTTGTTLEHAAAAVHRAGGQLVGCAVFAARPL